MTIFVCIDDRGGMSFNGRRQSRDSVVAEKMVEMSDGGRLLMSEYSAKLFNDCEIIVDDCFLENATAGDFCFFEKGELAPYEDKIEKLVVFKWNRTYPFDVSFELSFEGKQMLETFEFAGSSHDNITCEVWQW